jgi:hypothetical protein
MPVTAGDQYRAKALELLARAEVEINLDLRAEFAHLAAAYMRLAEQAERNSGLIIDIELPPEKPKPKH